MSGASNAAATTPAFAVTGHPVNHSLSPLIHRQFAAASGIAMSYDLLPAPADRFAEVANEFFAGGGMGLNVTLPFKEQAAELVDYCDPAATLAGAVNTIRRDPDGRLAGFNTDGIGLLQDLAGNLGWPITGQRVLLIGAGGASRGALDALLNGSPGGGPAELWLANRTLAKAEALVRALCPNDSRVQVCAPAALTGRFDLVVNATSASLAGRGALVPTDVVRGARCYDMLYANQQTVFAGWAMSHGALEVADGLGMLLEQAAAAFEIWHGVRPTTATLLGQRDLLFDAQRRGLGSVTGNLASASLSSVSSVSSAAADEVKPKRRFIAGAVCPQCREIDRLVVQSTADGGQEQACVACGFHQPAPESSAGATNTMVPRGKPERAPAVSPEQAAETPTQTVRFVEPAPAQKSAADGADSSAPKDGLGEGSQEGS